MIYKKRPLPCSNLFVRGFTLIELLIAVLIIGILTAIALPQYQNAVEKTKATEALTIVKTLKNAQDIYFLTTGKYTKNFNDLDMNIPNTGACNLDHERTECIHSKNWIFQLWVEGDVEARSKNGDLIIGWWQSLGPYKKTLVCFVLNSSTNAAKYNKLCKSLNGVVTSYNDSNWTAYALR